MRPLALLLVLRLLAAGQETPVFRTDTRLVEVQVVVTGRGGAPVEGLTEGDFTVLENGKRQKIAFFAAPPARAAVAAPRDALPPGIFTNRPEYMASRPRGVTAIVLDVLNTGRGADQYFARSALMRFLRGLQGDELVGVYVLGNGIRVIHDFSDDPASLARMAQRVRNEWPAGGASQEETMRAEADLLAQVAGVAELEASLGAMGELHAIQVETRIRMTLQQLEMIGEHLAGVPGRKAMVWLSAGMPMLTMRPSPMAGPDGHKLPYYESFAGRYARTAERLGEANVAVYPVDARGLRIGNDTPLYQPNLGRGGGGVDRAMWMRDWQAVPAQETFSSMQYLAEATGGRALYNSNDLEGGLRQAADDLKANYTVAYYTSLSDDAKKRELQVKTNRRGVEVLARRRVPVGRREALVEVKDLLESPIAVGGVLVNGRVTRREGELAVTLQIEPGSLLLTRNGAHTEGVVEVYLAQILPSGERRVADARLELRLTEAEVRRVVEEGLVYQRTLPLIAEAERLRVVVRDARSGAAGSFDAAVRLMSLE